MVVFSFYSRIYRSLKRVWRRRKYQRLDNSGNRNLRIVRLGGNKRRVLKIRAIPKLQLKLFSPIKLLTRLRDAYIDAMIGFATSTSAVNDDYRFGGKKATNGRQVGCVYNEDLEKRVLFEVYRSLASREEGLMNHNRS